MRPHWRNLLLVASAMALTGVDAVYADEQHQCFLESIQATYKAGTSTYRVEAGCRWYTTAGTLMLEMHWSSQGTYDPRTGLAREDITIGLPKSPATVTTTLSCPSDPWLGPSLEPGMVVCRNPTFQASGEARDINLSWFHYLLEGFYSTVQDKSILNKKIGPLPNSTGFQYTRADLIAQRDAVAKAEAAAALQQQNKRLQMGAPRVQPITAPTILSPAPSALFLTNNSVPIRIAPPQGLAVTGYLVRVELRNAQGQWMLVTNLPVSAAEAHSPLGYLGWGAAGPGRGAMMIANPGTYHFSAQVSSPRQAVWSQPVEFVVTSPNKAIQKAPKMFEP